SSILSAKPLLWRDWHDDTGGAKCNHWQVQIQPIGWRCAFERRNVVSAATERRSPLLRVSGDRLQRAAHQVDMTLRHAGVERKRQRPLANTLGHREVTRFVAELFLKVGGQMYRPVVDDGLNAELLKAFDHSITERCPYPYRVEMTCM